MRFQAPGEIPGLEKEADRALGKLFNDLEIDLQEMGAGQSVTPRQFGNYLAKLGEFVRVVPPAAGSRVLLPAATVTNQGRRVLIGIESVASGGTVTLAVAGVSQLVNNAATVVVSVAGLVLAYSTGIGWVCTLLSSGGGGGNWASVLAAGPNSGANTPIIDAGQALNLAAGATGITADANLTASAVGTLELDAGGDMHLHPQGALHLGHTAFTDSIQAGATGNITLVGNDLDLIAATTVHADAGTDFVVSAGAAERLRIEGADGSWNLAGDPGTAGEVLTSQGAAAPPLWVAPAAGAVAMTDATVTLAFAGKQSDTVVVVDAAIGAGSKLLIGWGTVLDTDANSPELDDVTFSATPAAGSMTVRVSAADQLDRVGGAYKIRYLIG